MQRNMPRNMSTADKIFLALRILAFLVAITGVVGLGWATAVLSSPDAGTFMEELGYVGLAISGVWCLIAAVATFLHKDRIHPALFITVDLLVGLLVSASGAMALSSPFARMHWIACDGSSYSSMCKDPTERAAVAWRFVAAAFCFLNVLIHLAVVIAASKACHQRRKGAKGKSDDVELTS